MNMFRERRLRLYNGFVQQRIRTENNARQSRILRQYFGAFRVSLVVGLFVAHKKKISMLEALKGAEELKNFAKRLCARFTNASKSYIIK